MRASILLFALPAAVFGQAGAWYQRDFPPEEFRLRWEKVFDHIGRDAVAVVQGAPLTNGFIMPRQSNEFYYLCGIETPHAYVLLDGRNRKARMAASLWFRSAEGALRTIYGYEAMHLIRKGQIRWLPQGDVVGQRQFFHSLFGIAA